LSSLFNNDAARNKIEDAINSGMNIHDAIDEYRRFDDYSITPIFSQLRDLLKLNTSYDDNYNNKFNELRSNGVDKESAQSIATKFATKAQDFPDKIEIQLITKSAPKSIFSELLRENDFPISRHAYFGGNIRLLNNYVSKGLDIYISKNPISVDNLTSAGFTNAFLYDNNEHEVLNKIDEALERLENDGSLDNTVSTKVHSGLVDRRNKVLPSSNIEPLKIDININSLFNEDSFGSSYNMINFMQSVNDSKIMFDINVYSDSNDQLSEFQLMQLDSLSLSIGKKSNSAELNITSNQDESRDLLSQGVPSILLSKTSSSADSIPNNISTFDFFFDGDAVVFGDESERAYKEGSLKGFVEFEELNKDVPLSKGPFYPLFKKVSEIAMHINKDKDCNKTLGICMLTARSAHNSSSRVAHHENELYDMGLNDVVTVIFAGGSEKARILEDLSDYSDSTSAILIDDGNAHIDGVNLLRNTKIAAALAQTGINHQI
jgi:hypothetical protein